MFLTQLFIESYIMFLSLLEMKNVCLHGQFWLERWWI